MLNRRFLRIKIFQALYGFSQEENPQAHIYRKQMVSNLKKTFELYLFCLAFPIELKFYLQQELEAEKSKYFPNETQIAEYQAILNNQVATFLEESEELKLASKNTGNRWKETGDFFKSMLTEIKEEPLYKEYVAQATHSFGDDKQFIITCLEWLFADSVSFNNYLEENFLNWEDDQVLILSTLQKTIGGIKENKKSFLQQMHKDEEEDIKFMNNLFDLTLQENDELNTLIMSKTQNWDQDRIAIVDMILMKMALCEILHFPFIPVKVSINEYLELAKLYSTPNSHSFINGVLDKIQLQLKKDQKINKSGRGLME